MAENQELTRSQIGASDVIYNFCCTPCAKDGKNSEAEYQCVDCQPVKYFCHGCVGFHNQSMGAHTLLDKTTMHSGKGHTLQNNPSKSVPLPADTCYDHPEKVIEMFCGQHDLVCCTVCIDVDHRSCGGVEYIPTVAKGILKGMKKQQTQTSVETVIKELLQLKARRKNDLCLVDKQRDDMLNDVHTLKKHIIASVEELEKTSNEQVLLKHKEITDDLNSDITSLEDMLKIMQVKLDNITQFKTINEAQLFVLIKHCNAQASKGSDYVNQVESKRASTIVYELDTDIEYCLHDMKSLITLTDDTNHPYIVSPLGEYCIKVEPDNKRHSIYGVCVLDNNQTIITDHYNNRLKRLDSTFKVTDWVDIPGYPWGICKTGLTELAVTLYDAQKVQFIYVDMLLSPTRSFNVDESCRGICHSQGELYVCCGGWPGECPGQVRVYDMSGSKLRVLQPDQIGQQLFTLPYNITVSRNSSLLYIADMDTGVIAIDKQGNTQTVITNPRLKSTHDVTVDDRGQLFVCGFGSHNVIQTDRRCNVLQELLTRRTDGITYPISVTYLENPLRIMLTQDDCGKFKIFRLR